MLEGIIPAHDTIRRVFRLLDSEQFAEYLNALTNEVIDFLEEQHIAIDGKIDTTMHIQEG